MPDRDVDDLTLAGILDAGEELVDQVAALCQDVDPEVALAALIGAALGCAVNATDTEAQAAALFRACVDRVAGRLTPLWPEISKRKNGRAN